jgi:hypothetical protein
VRLSGRCVLGDSFAPLNGLRYAWRRNLGVGCR